MLPVDLGLYARQRHPSRYAVPSGGRARRRRAGVQRRTTWRLGYVYANDGRDAIVLDHSDDWVSRGSGADGARARLVGSRRGVVRRSGSVLRVPSVLARRRAVRRAVAWIRGVFDHAAGVPAERRPVYGPTKLLRQCVLYEHGRTRLACEPAVVSRFVLRRG